MKTSDFFFELPEELIAQHPDPSRDHSKLLVLNRQQKTMQHHRFFELPELLQPGDLLVVNDSKVIPARLFGKKSTGGGVEVLLLKSIEETADSVTWECLTRGKNLSAGAEISFTQNDGAEVRGMLLEKLDDGVCRICFPMNAQTFHTFLQEQGHIPLPPYIKHTPLTETQLRETYQTVYATQEGSVAAPTAGLHFTPAIFDALEQRGVHVARVTLHVGLGTFLPVKSERVEEHQMHAEEAIISPETAAAVNAAKQQGRRIIAVGTTSVRTLESFMQKGLLQSGRKMTSIFITPGYQFQCIDGMITNFHLPQSTLLMLVSAFAGTEFTKTAYVEAVREHYRFYSFGDAMLIV